MTNPWPDKPLAAWRGRRNDRYIVAGRDETMQANETTIWYASKGSGGQGLIADEVTGRSVAVCYDETDKDLLTAAPELLQACKDVAQAYQCMFDVMPVAWQTFDDIVTAAIAKAEGR